MLPSLRALVFPMAQCSTSSAQNCKRLRSYIQHNCALPDADDFALRAQNFKIADSRCCTSASRAQKPQFCARKARKRGSRRAKKHKNLDFVLEMPENEGPEGQKSTKTQILCSGRRGLASGNSEMASGIVKVAFLQITARTNPRSRHLWGTLARSVASI